jgi:hypothetical protein
VKKLESENHSNQALRGQARRRGSARTRKARDLETISLVAELKNHFSLHPQELQAILRKLVSLARMGDLRAIDMIINRLDGLPVQNHTVSGELPIRLQFVPYNLIDVRRPETILEAEARELPDPDQLELKDTVNETLAAAYADS